MVLRYPMVLDTSALLRFSFFVIWANGNHVYHHSSFKFNKMIVSKARLFEFGKWMNFGAFFEDRKTQIIRHQITFVRLGLFIYLKLYLSHARKNILEYSTFEEFYPHISDNVYYTCETLSTPTWYTNWNHDDDQCSHNGKRFCPLHWHRCRNLAKNPDMFLSLLWSLFNSLFKLYHVRSPDNLRGYHAFEVCESDMFIFFTK